MRPLRLFTFLFVLIVSYAAVNSELVTGTLNENQEQVPCDNEVKITSTAVPTTKKNHCPGLHGVSAPYKRKNGWWCTVRVSQDRFYDVPFSVADGEDACKQLNMVIMSFETNEEYAAYHGLAKPDPNADAYWVAASLNSTNGQYYWSDGFAVPTMNPQPNIVDPKGHVAWIVNKDSSVPGYGKFSVVRRDGYSTPNVRAVLCGAPGVD